MRESATITIAIIIGCCFVVITNAEDQYCEAGSSFMNDCNICSFSPDGKHAFCTLKGCPKPPLLEGSRMKRAEAGDVCSEPVLWLTMDAIGALVRPMDEQLALDCLALRQRRRQSIRNLCYL